LKELRRAHVFPFVPCRFYTKYLWRENFVVCDAKCDLALGNAACACHCEFGERTPEEALRYAWNKLQNTTAEGAADALIAAAQEYGDDAEGAWRRDLIPYGRVRE
jgi:hypothetical protein